MEALKKVLWWIGIPPAVVGFWTAMSASVYWFDDIQEMRRLVLQPDPITGLTPHEHYEVRMTHLDYLIEHNDALQLCIEKNSAEE